MIFALPTASHVILQLRVQLVLLASFVKLMELALVVLETVPSVLLLVNVLPMDVKWDFT